MQEPDARYKKDDRNQVAPSVLWGMGAALCA